MAAAWSGFRIQLVTGRSVGLQGEALGHSPGGAARNGSPQLLAATKCLKLAGGRRLRRKQTSKMSEKHRPLRWFWTQTGRASGASFFSSGQRSALPAAQMQAFLSKPASAEPCLHTRALAGICSGFHGEGFRGFSQRWLCGAARFLGLSLGGRMSSVGCRSGVPAESLLASDTETT